MWQRTIDCLGATVRIQTSLGELEPQLTAVLETYAESTRPPDVYYVLDYVEAHPRLHRDGAVINHQASINDLVPAFEMDLLKIVIGRVQGLALHAGAVVGPSGGAIIFTGRSGAGKSTLVRALLRRGFTYLSEECVAMLAGQRCVGLARALHVEDAELAIPDGFTCAPYLIDNRPANQFRLFHPPEHLIWRGEARSAAIIAIDHATDADDALVRLSDGAALAALWPTVFRQDPAALEFTKAGLDGVPAYKLVTSHPQRALDHVLSLAIELGV